MAELRRLLLDIEISPNLAAVWGLWNQNINITNLINDSEVLSWAAMWAGDEEVQYSSLGMTDKKSMLKEIYKLLDEADAVVTYNGDRFDLKILQQEFLLQGWTPPTPYKSIDLLKTMKKQFRGTSNKLDYWLKRLGLGQKGDHRGAQLWLDCMNKVPGAFEEMEEYNIKDVIVLEALYDRILPWIKGLPNQSVMLEAPVCPACGGKHHQRRGFHITQAGKYQRYQCKCGFWFRGNKTEVPLKDKFLPI